MGDPLLVACVHEVRGYNRSAKREVSAEALAEYITIYALSLTMETIRRESDIEMTLPTLENLLSIDRIIQFGQINPDFGRFLEKACVVPQNGKPVEKSWFKQLKQKILSRVSEG